MAFGTRRPSSTLDAAAQATGPQIELVGVRKVFAERGADVVAVDDADLAVDDGELFAILGPSGSGKTTVLRMIAGFEQPTAGAILLGGGDVTALPPVRRDVNTVFQDYALFPHMTVAQNVEYGLKVKRRREGRAPPTGRRGARPGPPHRSTAARQPAQLSGGQRQRVALARALVGPAEGAAARRTARRARPQAARGDAGRAQGDPARGGHHVRLRHPRPGRGADAVRPAGGVQRRDASSRSARPRDVYEHPANRFVAGLRRHLQRARRRRCHGGARSDGGTFAVRPETHRGAATADAPVDPAGRTVDATSPRWSTPGRPPASRVPRRRRRCTATVGSTATQPPSSAARPRQPVTLAWPDTRRRSTSTTETSASDQETARDPCNAFAAWRRAAAAACAAPACVAARAVRRHSGRAPPKMTPRRAVGDGEGAAQHHRVGRATPRTAPTTRRQLGDAVREGDRLQGQRQDRQHLRRDGPADAHRPVRRRVGVGRRHAAADLRRRRRPGEHRPGPQLRRPSRRS